MLAETGDNPRASACPHVPTRFCSREGSRRAGPPAFRIEHVQRAVSDRILKRRKRRTLSRRPRNLFACLALCILGSVHWGTSSVRAEPYLAIQEGYKCSQCHVNMTGGGKRTDFANIYTQTRLAGTFFDWRSFTPKPGEDADKDNPVKTDSQSSFFTGRLNDYVAIGGDFRVLYDKTKTSGVPSKDAFTQRKQNVYLEVDLIPDHAVFYQTLADGGDAREIFGLLKGELKGEPFYLKAGQFFLPYGLRLQDDTAVTRAVTGFTYGTTDVGVELGFEPGPMALHIAATNGTGSSLETNHSKRLTGSLAYVHRRFRAGGSYSENRDAQGVKTKIYGGHAGAQFGRVGILAEAAVIDDSTVKQRVSILEFNLLLSRGNNLKFSYEYHDPSLAVFENARVRYSLVYEPFLNQFTQMRVGVRDKRGIPQNAELNANEYFLELHLFF